MVCARQNLLCPPDDHPSPRRMHFFQTLGDDRNIARTDLEQTVAAERTALTALQVLRLGRGDGAKEIVRASEDARICFVARFFGHATHNR